MVTFSVEDGITLSDSTFATIRFRNLVGQRYLTLTQGYQGVGDASVYDREGRELIEFS